MVGTCPGIFILRKCVVRQIWYLRFLDSQTCLQRTAQGSGAFLAFPVIWFCLVIYFPIHNYKLYLLDTSLFYSTLKEILLRSGLQPVYLWRRSWKRLVYLMELCCLNNDPLFSLSHRATVISIFVFNLFY